MTEFTKAMLADLSISSADDVSSVVSSYTLSSHTQICEDIVNNTADVYLFVEKCYLLSINPKTNYDMYYKIIKHIIEVIDSMFVENLRCSYDKAEFDNMLRMLFTNPEQPFMMIEDIHNNYDFYCKTHISDRADDERFDIFSKVLERMVQKHTLQPKRLATTNKNCTLRVGNLMTYHTMDETKQQMRLIFGKYGVIRDIKVPMDYGTGNPRGYAFVQFLEPIMAENALTNTQDKIKIGSRMLRIDYALGEKKGPV